MFLFLFLVMHILKEHLILFYKHFENIIFECYLNFSETSKMMDFQLCFR